MFECSIFGLFCVYFEIIDCIYGCGEELLDMWQEDDYVKEKGEQNMQYFDL